MNAAGWETSVSLRGAAWLVGWAVLAGLDLILAGSLKWPEVVAGCVTAAVAVVTLGAVRIKVEQGFAPGLAWLALVGRLSVRVPSDCGVVLGAILRCVASGRPVSGRFRTIPFDPGGDDGRAEARRALAIAGISFAPNTIAVALGTERRRMLVHQLVPTPEPPGGGDQEWPV